MKFSSLIKLKKANKKEDQKQKVESTINKRQQLEKRVDDLMDELYVNNNMSSKEILELTNNLYSDITNFVGEDPKNERLIILKNSIEFIKNSEELKNTRKELSESLVDVIEEEKYKRKYETRINDLMDKVYDKDNDKDLTIEEKEEILSLTKMLEEDISEEIENKKLKSEILTALENCIKEIKNSENFKKAQKDVDIEKFGIENNNLIDELINNKGELTDDDKKVALNKFNEYSEKLKNNYSDVEEYIKRTKEQLENLLGTEEITEENS